MSHEIWKKINKLDFTHVKEKVTSKKGLWWNWTKDVGKLEKEYKQFLYLIATHPGETVVPWTQDLDDFWHEHILDTAKYEKDCQDIFGKFIHHNPHLPVGTPEQQKGYRNTQKMYKETFGAKAKNRKKDGSAKSDDSTSPGCGAIMPIIFCGVGCSSHSSSSHSSSSGCGAAACSSGSSGGSSCSSGGSSCGGGGGCGGGGCGGGCGS